MMRHTAKIALLALILTGCAAAPMKYEPIVDRPSENYQADLSDCRALAEKSHPAGDAVGGAVLGTVAGGLLGAAIGGRSGAAFGAKIGAGEVLIGGAAHGLILQKTVVMSCLIGRGHRVIG
jgi:uncharacterized protein YcfJ